MSDRPTSNHCVPPFRHCAAEEMRIFCHSFSHMASMGILHWVIGCRNGSFTPRLFSSSSRHRDQFLPVHGSRETFRPHRPQEPSYSPNSIALFLTFKLKNDLMMTLSHTVLGKKAHATKVITIKFNLSITNFKMLRLVENSSLSWYVLHIQRPWNYSWGANCTSNLYGQ